MDLEKQLGAVTKGAGDASHQQIQRIIARSVESGDLAPGSRLPAERRLAEACLVSRTTVRLALESLVHQGYVEKRPGSGIYVKTPPGRRVVGCVLPNLDPYGKYQWAVLLAQNVVRQVRARGYGEAVYLLGSGEDRVQIQRDLVAGRVHGLLSLERLGDIDPALPVVYGNLGQGCYRVIIDYAAMVQRGVDFLAGRGCRRIALVTYKEQTRAGNESIVSLKASLAKHGLPYRRNRVVQVEAFSRTQSPEEIGRQALLELWRGKDLPDAVVFTEDWHALGAVRALAEMGVDMPGQVRVISHVNRGYVLPFPGSLHALELDPARIAGAMLDLLEKTWRAPKTAATVTRVAPVLMEEYPV